MALATGSPDSPTTVYAAHRLDRPRWMFHIHLAHLSYLLSVVAWKVRAADRVIESWALAQVRVRRDLVLVFFLSYVVTFAVAVLAIAGQR